MMSRDVSEVIQAGFDTWNANDMDAYRELLDPDVSWRPLKGWPEPGPYVGRDAVMRQLEQLRETWDGDVLEPIEDFRVAGDRVLVKVMWRGAGGHGPELNLQITGVWAVRDGRICGIEFFQDHAEALEAAGLSE